MFFSKSFGYALRGILYIALLQDEQRKIQIDEIADKLSVPRHFLGKIMQNVVKAGLLQSTKGPYGGFSLDPNTLTTPLIKLVETTDGMDQFNFCVLQLRNCNKTNPCPLHNEADKIKTRLFEVLNQTTIGDLLTADKKLFIKSLATI
jgi:Rrf2 family protein